MSLYCSITDCLNLPERNGICATHNHEQRKAERNALKPVKKYVIPKRSDKKKKADSEYMREKPDFMKGKICPIYPHLPVKDIHHMKGRTGALMMDERYWLAVSRKGHIKIELNPTWAREKGYSLPRQ